MADDFFARLDSMFEPRAFGDPARAAVILRVLLDHLWSRADHPGADVARLEGSILACLPAVPPLVVEAMRERILAHPQTPPGLRRALGRFRAGPATAAKTPVDRDALIARAERGDVAEATAIAGRDDIDATLAAILARRPEPDVLMALVANPHARLDRAAMAFLVSRGRRSRPLAAALLARGLLPVDATSLFLAAGAAQRAEMLLDARRRELGRAPEPRRPAPALDDAIESALETGGAPALAAVLAGPLGLSRGESMRLVADEGGEPLALLLNAAGADASSAALALGTVPGARDPRRFSALLALACETPAAVARRVISAVAGRPIGEGRETRRGRFERADRASPPPAHERLRRATRSG